MSTPKNREELIKLMSSVASEAIPTHEGADRQSAHILEAMEAAGVVVMPEDPTPEMISLAADMYCPMGEMIAAYDGFRMASPYAPKPPLKSGRKN